MDREALIHFVGGAVGGTAGTAITCPLEVVKTRLQSSKFGFDDGGSPSASSSTSGASVHGGAGKPSTSSISALRATYGSMDRALLGQTPRISVPTSHPATPSFHESRSARDAARKRAQRAIFKYTSDIIKKEGIPALYKGLLPNVIGVAPSKAVYFYTYSTSKRFWNSSDIFVPNSAIVYMVSAGSAGFVTSTAINPVWLVKTRLQLHHGPLSIRECIRRIYQEHGIRGFYKGVTASYMGISETIIQFVLYENLRGIIDNMTWTKENTKFFNFMVAGGIAKFVACVLAYPHEVVRTRLREENTQAKGFFKTLFSLYKENGYRGLYRGLSIQLLRSVPNTAITMGTYETVVYLAHTYFT